MPKIKAHLITETGVALCLTQPDTDGAVTWWLPKSQLQSIDRQETMTGTIVTAMAPDWLISETACHVLKSEQQLPDKTASLPGF